MKKSFLSLSLFASLCLLSLPSYSSSALTLENVTKDVSYLASDDLKGRASFSPEIDKAANYIGHRFNEIGLVSFDKKSPTSTYKQSFSIFSIQPEILKVNVNGTHIAAENLAIASTFDSLQWNSQLIKDEAVSFHHIKNDDDFRATLSTLNQAGGEHLVFVSPAHQKMFLRYQNYFNRGLTKLNLSEQGALVLVLTDETTPENITVNATTSISKKTLTNVVGVLPGKTKPEEIVLFSAHYDHLGLVKDATDGDKIFNGADDDASGTSAVINIAEYYANKGDNARTLMFAAFTAEEIGGFGSRYFSEQLNPNDISAMINIEMIGKPSKFGPGNVWMTGMERSNLGALLNENLKDKGIKIHQDPYPEQGLFYRSDNATLARLGVPAHSFSSTQLDKDKHYHKVSDDLASLDLNSMFKVIELLAIGSQGLVDGTVTPSRVDVNKVKSHGLIY